MRTPSRFAAKILAVFGSAVACAASVFFEVPEAGAQVFEAHSLRVTGEIKDVKSADLDGDGRRELLVSSTTHRKGTPERTLHICRWEGGEAHAAPALRDAWAVPADAVFWDVGPDKENGQGKSVYFITLDGLFEVAGLHGSGQAIQPRIEAPVLLSVGQEDEFLWKDVIRDWDGDGSVEAMLPLGREVRFYRWEGALGWKSADSARLSPLAYYNNDIFFGRDLGGYEYLSVLLYPLLEPADLNGDGKKDLLALRNGKGFCYLRRQNGKLDADPFVWDVEIRTEEELAKHRATLSYRVADLNRDGCADVVVHKVAMNLAVWDAETAVFLGRPGPARPKDPDQRFPSRGLLSGVSLDDLDGDGYADATVWSIKMGLLPLVEILLRGIVHIRSHSYYGAWPGGFPAKAASEGDFELYIDSDRPDFIRGLVPNTKGDFNRDGLKDLVAARGADTMAIYLGLPSRRFSSRPWAVLDAPGVNYVRVEDLDGNGLGDLYGYEVRDGFSQLHLWLQGSPARPSR